MKVSPLYVPKDITEDNEYAYLAAPGGSYIKLSWEEKSGYDNPTEIFKRSVLTSSGYTRSCTFAFNFQGREVQPLSGKSWRTNAIGMKRLVSAERLFMLGRNPYFRQYHGDFGHEQLENSWHDTAAGFSEPKVYVVQTNEKIIQRCMLMASSPGDLVLDPTCGSGTTAYVAEKWGRRWITIDSSRVSISLARQRLLTRQYEYYRLRSDKVSLGFLLKTLPRIELGRDIAQNHNLDPIFEKKEPILDRALAICNEALAEVTDELRARLKARVLLRTKNEGKRASPFAKDRLYELPDKGKHWQEWQIPKDTDPEWPKALQDAVIAYRKVWRAKMDEVNACIAANADQEELVDQPEIVKGILRVSGPFTVEGMRPEELSLGKRGLFDATPGEGEKGGASEDIIDEVQNLRAYLSRMVELIRKDGITFPNNRHQDFARLEPLYEESAGTLIHAEAIWKGVDEKESSNIGITFGPQYGPMTAEQVGDIIRAGSRYDELVIAGFSFDAAALDAIQENKHLKQKIHIAHIRPDVSPGMDGLLKDAPNSQIFTVFGQPEIRVYKTKNDEYVVELLGVDIYDPLTGEVRSTKADKVAAWFLDSDYDSRCFCITQAFFPDQNAWEKIAKSLGSQADTEAFEALNGTVSIPFKPGKHRRVAAKVIDPRGNEVIAITQLETDGN